MAEQTAALLDEARAMGLFRQHAAFEVHCSNCHARLDGSGDCPTCGIITLSEAEMAERAKADPTGAEKLLRRQIERRRAYRPVKAAARE